jgi:dienelactone hydrolase
VQGADILAHAGNFSVYVPDWFVGKYADITWYPPDTEEKKAAMKDVFTRGSPAVVGAAIARWMGEVRKEGEKWGIVGLCWGGKVAAVAIGAEERIFDCGAMAHPAMVDPADAAKISVPFAVLPSKDEDPEVVKRFSEALKGKKVVETFGDQIHGWMGARGNLEDPRCREEYERGYKLLVDFFGENLG